MSQHTDDNPKPRSSRELALNVGAVLGLVCIVVAIASMLFGITPLVFRSGSMSPDIPTGSLALARTVDATDLRVGDVVSVDNEVGTRITHRVVDIENAGGGSVSLTLKGDANRVPDPSPYQVTEADRVIGSVPVLGYAAAWLSSKTAIFIGGVVAGVLLMLAFGPIRRPRDSTLTTDEPAVSEPKLQEADHA
ncbi:signal peptidase I [Gordonia sp. PDNC005]|uniref:signal peptidase I n=1 Tax=unclassified Gordonia (in: high G+C Gram-positive bacteria) TaxID=2657482 RepID=UPI0019637DC1|nr:signal peptidase I [Gordonia sp. PDNC005]QRY62024.1 signal peptidase I [Gordonia sp. PDNC005]